MVDIRSANYQEEPSGSFDMSPIYSSIPLYPSYSGWNYTMRRNMQEIIPGLFLGPYSAALKQCRKQLLDTGITHIICVRQNVEANHIHPQLADPFTYLTLDIADNVTENIIRFFPQVKSFIDDALARNFKVLVHGNNGISRSATLVLAYVMEKFGLSSLEAFQYVKEKRSCISPNDGFIAQLIEYEPIYKARQTLEKGETSCDNRRLKRKCEDLCDNSDYDLIQPPPSPICFNSNENFETAEDLPTTVCKLLLQQTS